MLNKANEVNLGGVLRHAEDFLAKAQTLPQNTSADGNGGSFQLSDTIASVEIVAVANTAIALADTENLTIKLQQSTDNGVADAFADLSTIFTLTAAGGNGAIAAGTELGRAIVPLDAERYIKAVLVSDDAALTGKVDVFAVYLPR